MKSKKNRMKKSNNSTRTLGMLLTGAITGAAVGLLLAPEKGKETREKLYKKGNKVADDVEKKFEELGSGLKTQIENSKKELAEMMDNGNWFRGKVRQKLSALTGDNLLFAKGKKDELLSKLGSKVGKSKEELENIISEL